MKTLKLIRFFTVSMVILFGFPSGIVLAEPCKLPDLDSAVFTAPLLINNPFWPLEPGTTFIYEPVPNEEDVVNTVAVTGDFKTITVKNQFIDCRVVHDVETVGGKITEDTYDWYAQDDEGNIWYCGEDTTAYLEDGTTSKEGSWEAGKDGALPGHLILANPSPGACYQQEYADGAQDRSKVLRLNAKVALENGDSYEDCLVTKEWTPLSPGNVEHKYYAASTGLVLIEELKGKSVRVELIRKVSTP
jgi:hypothetical protein